MSGGEPGDIPVAAEDQGGATSSPVASVEVVYPLDQVYEASNDILDALEESGMEVSLGVFALVLTLGRVLTPKEMTPQDEQAFVQQVLEFMHASLADGRAN